MAASLYAGTAKLFCLNLKQIESINLDQILMKNSTTKKERISRMDGPNVTPTATIRISTLVMNETFNTKQPIG